MVMFNVFLVETSINGQKTGTSYQREGTNKLSNLDGNIASLVVKLITEDVKENYDDVPIDEVLGARIYENIYLHSWKFANTPIKISNFLA
ncbi:perakine reductase-like [Macadamia integrifolia]|uniref:perakine reductase-like n=1 Tax=Macadamia integrifolia TaxID=60698 RepID=UPI001C4F58C7|nr:perakine reductase-like [Macadamia integrifolia]